MNAIPKVVFSTTLTRGLADHDHRRRPLPEEVARLKSEPGGDIIVLDGFTLAQALTRADLVDVHRLVTRPVALGSGEAMFKDLSSERRLHLSDATTYPDSSVISIYRRQARANR